jgi:Ca2+-binding EF-hand superfamily protein
MCVLRPFFGAPPLALPPPPRSRSWPPLRDAHTHSSHTLPKHRLSHSTTKRRHHPTRNTTKHPKTKQHKTPTQQTVSQAEVEALYARFRALDRGRKGYISAEEFLAIPELSINPLAQRLVRFLESVNFLEFARTLAPFSTRASRADRLRLLFAVYDVDGDGLVSREDLQIMLRQLGGSTLSDDDVDALIAKAFAEAGVAASRPGLDEAAFRAAMGDADLGGMVIDIPVLL